MAEIVGFDEKSFLAKFEAQGKQRALELLLSALITTHPEPHKFRIAIDHLMREEENLFYKAAESLDGDAVSSAHAIGKAKYAAMRDKAEKVISATVGWDP
ncbi:TPA: hypothetical protein QEL15_004279 [Stenotrophomonas maltophilia]|nr:hypothetical protein [Stenotrophomonas maltophilia]